MMKIQRPFLLAGVLLLAGCGYRAPLYQSYIPVVKDTTEYPGVRPAYQALAALMEKDTGMEPTEGNTVTLLPDGQKKWDILKEDLEYADKSIYIDHYRFCTDSAGSIVENILREKSPGCGLLLKGFPVLGSTVNINA